jgi:hypothetical protein
VSDIPVIVDKPNLAIRLDKALQRFDNHLSRMRSAFDRIHGSPTAPSEARDKPISTATPLAISVDRAESLVNQLGEILHRLDAIG